MTWNDIFLVQLFGLVLLLAHVYGSFAAFSARLAGYSYQMLTKNQKTTAHLFVCVRGYYRFFFGNLKT